MLSSARRLEWRHSTESLVGAVEDDGAIEVVDGDHRACRVVGGADIEKVDMFIECWEKIIFGSARKKLYFFYAMDQAPLNKYGVAWILQPNYYVRPKKSLEPSDGGF